MTCSACGKELKPALEEVQVDGITWSVYDCTGCSLRVLRPLLVDTEMGPGVLLED